MAYTTEQQSILSFFFLWVQSGQAGYSLADWGMKSSTDQEEDVKNFTVNVFQPALVQEVAGLTSALTDKQSDLDDANTAITQWS